MRRYPAYPVILMLIISMLANGLSLSFRGEVFSHELDHIHQLDHSHSFDHSHQSLSADPETYLELHHDDVSWDGVDIDAATHLCLHAVGQYQPFFFNSFPLIPDLIVTKAITLFISSFIPETVPDLLLRPPRSISFL